MNTYLTYQFLFMMLGTFKYVQAIIIARKNKSLAVLVCSLNPKNKNINH